MTSKTDTLFGGIDIGSTNIKLVLTDATGQVVWFDTAPHDGDLPTTLHRLLDNNTATTHLHRVRKWLATGTEGRHRLNLPSVIAPRALEAALAHDHLSAEAVVCMGGEDLVVYSLDDHDHITATYSGNKCACGTGEFFRQQMGRMDLHLEQLDTIGDNPRIQKISSRCSVFMKSDCTHKLNKGESTPWDIAVSLSKVMADKVSDFLAKAKIEKGTVVLTGGVTRNRFIPRFLKAANPNLAFHIPEQSTCFEALGASLLAQTLGTALPPGTTAQFVHGQQLTYQSYPPLHTRLDQVTYAPSQTEDYDPHARYVLGVDGGSTTTKAVLLNMDTHNVAASHYGRTHGNPVQALKQCVAEIQRKIGADAAPNIILTTTTGSSRELLGVFLQTSGVYNEIIAHARGTAHYDARVDTIIEIGGQDAKYVALNNGVPVDYAMNEACSAGTGSFLEESCRGDLNIPRVEDIGKIALRASAPLKFGEHCSAFINSDIRKASQQGAPREDVVAGLVFSVVSNYLNRVSGNRRIGDNVVLQGGVARNPAVPLAFSYLTGRHITVPPAPELMGAFGVALVAIEKAADGEVAYQSISLDDILSRQIEDRGEFTCKACDNYCNIRRLQVAKKRYPFGGRCSRFTTARSRKTETTAINYVDIRTKMLFEDFAPPRDKHASSGRPTVGIPMAFSVHTLWPLYATFFYELGLTVIPSEAIREKGIAKTQSNYCFPAEIAHGAMQDIIEKNCDYYFLPMFKRMPSHEAAPVHATLCPLTQGMPFFLKQAFALEEDKILRPFIDMAMGVSASEDEFVRLATTLGVSSARGRAAFAAGLKQYEAFWAAYRELGRQVMSTIRQTPDQRFICLLGRPYNAFTRDANMGIPQKLISRGVTVVPFDMIYDVDAEIFPNMYWYYGQQNMKAVTVCAATPNLFPVWVSNFSCAPDSFMLHYLRWMMGSKPYLVLEIDSHTADAGVDTRLEAYLDIVDSVKKQGIGTVETARKRRYLVQHKKEFADIVDTRTGEKIDLRDPRVTLIWSSMGHYSSGAISAASERSGLHSTYLPIPDIHTLQLARNVASGKECIPSLLVLGGILQVLKTSPPRPSDIYVFYMPSTLGPCRTGQYHVFYERLFEDLGMDNAIILACDSANSYRELGSAFTRDAFWGVQLGDHFTDIATSLRLVAQHPEAAAKTLEAVWEDVRHTFATRGDTELALERAATTLKAIPRRRKLSALKKVLVVGEIFVRRDTYSVGEIVDFLIAKDIYPKVAPIMEWLDYTDHCRRTEHRTQKQAAGAMALFDGKRLKTSAMFHIEHLYKEIVSHKILRHLTPTGLIPDAPSDMVEIVDNAAKYFIDPRLESEATCSSGAAATGMLDGFDGTVIIAPFACLPGRLVEGVFAPWARERGFPYIALENDGQPYPPNVRARMEIFAYNVTRFKKQTKPKV